MKHSYQKNRTGVSSSVANSETVKNAVPVIDNRPNTIAQLSRSVMQLKSQLEWSGAQKMTVYNGANYQEGWVGKYIHAKIDPKEPLQGHATDSTEDPNLYNFLAHTYSQFFIRGHLLNHDLGGSNTNFNLFPITSHANSLHKTYVENHVKGWLVDGNTKDVEYEVTAKQGTNGVQDATFVCHAERTNMSNVVDKRINREIKSSPGNPIGHRADWAKDNYSDTEGSVFPNAKTLTQKIKQKKWLHAKGLSKKARKEVEGVRKGKKRIKRNRAHLKLHGYYSE